MCISDLQPAARGGVRVGHRIIEINGQSVVAVPHERIVNLLATSVGEIHMKTMYRLHVPPPCTASSPARRRLSISKTGALLYLKMAPVCI